MLRYILTNIGHKRYLERKMDMTAFTDEDRCLAKMSTIGVLSLSDNPMTNALISKNWITSAGEHTTSKEALLRYRRNPLEHVARINFEVTTLCNFSCNHCRNDGVELTTDLDTSSLKQAGRLFLSMGIRRYDFIGGEVSKFGTGWLEVAEHLKQADAAMEWRKPLAVTLYTNGWWLEREHFEAAGKSYVSEAEYLEDLRQHGVTHILFSIDGPEDIHDVWRGHPGLFRRVLAGIDRVRASGIKPRLTIVVRPNESLDYVRPFANAMYPDVRGDRLSYFEKDPMNHRSNFIDTGRGSKLRVGLHRRDTISPELLRCKAFFRPSPTLRIMANGEIGICPLMHGKEEYGNIHRRSLADILNMLQETPLYKLHADGEISQYLSQLDSSEFQDGFDHICAIRIAVNRLALAGNAR
jgi:MoaA/NifB/PqqE/SkfB family radical SAM enzyme